MKTNIKLFHGNQISEQNIISSYQIDKLVYKEEYIGKLETYFDWFQKNPDIYTMLVNSETGQTVGYINIMPVKPDFYNRYINLQIYDENGLNDGAITVNDLETYSKPGFYNLLFVSFAVHPEFQFPGIVKILINAFWENLLTLSYENIFINTILGDTVSGSGEKLSKLLSFKYLKATNYHTHLYQLNLPEFLKQYSGKQNVIKELKNKYC